MIVKTRGLVIRETVVGERERINTILSADLGKISVGVSESKRKNSRLTAGSQLFVYGEYVLFRGKNSYSLNECEVITSFFPLSVDLDLLTTAVRMTKFAEDAVLEPSTSADILKLILHALNKLVNIGKTSSQNDLKTSMQLVSSVFILKLLQINGYPPKMNGCAQCGTGSIDVIHFSFVQCGILCEKCSCEEPGSWMIDTGVVKAILYTLCAPIPDVFRFELDENTLEVFMNLVESYASDRLQKNYIKTLW